MSNIDKHSLLGVPKHANQHRLSRLTMEVHTDELRIMASAVESYTDELIAALEAAEKRIAELSGEFFALPPLNDDLIAILGRPNFICAHLAELLRKGGQDIRRKAEHEQAAVIYWFLDLYLKYGEKWESIAKDDIQTRVAMIAAAPKPEVK
ncbi:hypothetical protein [Enterobacter cloacae]|uniref:hypothetical protein n=1 Tax=Enterobacter cloacae TaxID=550 RepID=UPI0029311E69|nr:hypothetical protein [Enterobacter cloacae]